jgi:hypothetical protein
MKKLHPFLMALCAYAILLPPAASSATAQETDAAKPAKTEDSRPVAKKPVTPHNHMRDAKGMSIPAKQLQADESTMPVTDKSAAPSVPDTNKKALTKKTPRPHSHPQDGKGMYVPDKK